MKMFLFCAVGALALFFLSHVASGDLAVVKFEKFMQQFHKSYSSHEELQYRLSVFAKNMEESERFQKDEKGTAEYGVTKFSDLTAEEFRNYYGLDPDNAPDVSSLRRVTPTVPYPASHDWRKRGVISKVKHQGQCRSCWAFAAVANVEAQCGIQGCPKDLSVQQVIDCSANDRGCDGGYPWDAYITIQQQGGSVSESRYPYRGTRGNCKENLRPAANVKEILVVESNETAMASYVGNNGSLVVIINDALLRHYVKGVIHNIHRNCAPATDHVVLIVGYAGGKHLPYWIVKNSYGEDWGEKGYFRILRGKDVCGISQYPVAATVEIGKPDCKP